MTIKIIRRNWIHVLVWCLMILYFVLSPIVKDKITITEGLPSQKEPGSSQNTNSILYQIDQFSPISADKQKYFLIKGWSFLPTEKDQSNFDIYLVLTSDRKDYYFLTAPYFRENLNEALETLIKTLDFDGDLSNSGFQVNIAKEILNNGIYQIGFIYKNKSNGVAYYQSTNRELIKTPNQLKLNIEINSSSQIKPADPALTINPSKLLIPHQPGSISLVSSDDIYYSIDGLSPITIEDHKYFLLDGWSFLASDNDQSKYEIYIVLKSDQKELLYLTTAYERTGLQEALAGLQTELNVDIELKNSGFQTYIAADTLDIGNYYIGFLYKDKTSGNTSYQATDKILIKTSYDVQLATTKTPLAN